MTASLALTFWRGSELALQVLPVAYADWSRATRLPLTPFEVRDALEMALPQAGFRAAQFAPAVSYASATVESDPRGGRLNLKTRRTIEVAWREDDRQPGQTYVEWVVYDDRAQPRQFDAALIVRFGTSLQHAATQVLAGRSALPALLGPGERIDEREARRVSAAPDRMRDYSGCATLDEALGMLVGSWPAGRYLHVGRDTPPHAGPEIALGDARAILVIGEPGAGRTALLQRYAIEARWRGRHVLFVSRQASAIPGWRDLDVAHVDLFPAGPLTPASSLHIRELCAALMSDEASARQEAARQEAEWLAAFVHLSMLHAEATGADGAKMRLSDLAGWLLDERQAIAAIEAARDAESAAPVTHPARSARFWSAKLHGLLGPRWEQGKRDPAIPYEAAAAHLLQAIEPFLPTDDRPVVPLDTPAEGAATAMILRLPTDAGACGVVVPAMQRRLEQLLSRRDGRPLTVLVDDVARVARLAPERLVAAAEAGGHSTCILACDANGSDPDPRATAQVWLLPLAAPAAAALNRQLGARTRQVVSVEVTARQQRQARVTREEQAPCFHDADLRQPPGGRAPAVIVQRQPGQTAKPVLSDLDPAALAFLIDPDGGGHYRTIGDALRAVPAFARLRLRPGVYREELDIDTPVTLEGLGAPGNVVIAPPEWYAITSRAATLTLINLTLDTESAYALRVQAGAVVAMDCRMTSTVEIGGQCIGQFHNCQITRRHLDAEPGARLLVEDSHIRATEAAEAVLLLDAQARLVRCRLEGATKCALLTDGGQTRLEDCTLRDVRYGVIAFSSRPLLRRCVISDVSEAAILNQGGGDVRVEDSRIDGPMLRGDA